MNAQQLQEKIDRVKAMNNKPLADRYERGATIYKANHIKRVEGNEDFLAVPSSTNDGVAHLVQKEGAIIKCTCKDYHHNAPSVKGVKYCKHIIAASLLWVNGEYKEEVQS